MLGAKNSSQIDEFFTRGRHEDLDVYYISQSYFALPRQSIRNNSDRLILFKQTLRDVQSMYHDIGAFDMIYDEFKEMCRVAWDEKFNYLCIDMAKNKNGGKNRIFNESKNTYIECIPESEPFQIFQMLFPIKDREDLEKLKELATLQNQVKAVRLQDKLGEQNFHEDMKKVFEPVTKSLEKTSQDITKTITESSITNNEAIESLNNKLLEIMNDRGKLASYLISPLSKITNPENTTQF